MLSKNFRPWGQLGWLLKRLRSRRWSILGCLATEERCLTVYRLLKREDLSEPSLFVEITDQHSRFTPLASRLIQRNLEAFEQLGVRRSEIPQHPLLEIDQNIVDRIEDFLGRCGPSVIFDISCFPKRFFFPFMKRLLDDNRVENLIVTYSSPERYFNGTLAEDHRPLAHLPLFGPTEYPEPKPEIAVIGIGFVPLGISEMVDVDRQDIKFKLLFPFPPGPPFYHRNWRFLSDLRDRLPGRPDPIRVEAYNVSDTYDHIVELTGRGRLKTVFAPYGPKPMSLAMCLFAAQTRSPVYYTQPKVYHPEYTSGVGRVDGEEVSTAYCVKLGGRNLYPIESQTSIP